MKGSCRICGKQKNGQSFDKWTKPTFTDHDKCLFWFDERSEQLARLVGKKKPQRMRNYSHFIVDGVWIPISKADKPRMRELLQHQPEKAIIAISGQKHIAFRAQPGWWQIEEQTVQPFPKLLEQLLQWVEALYTTFNKSEIENGQYGQHRILKFGLVKWQEIEKQIAPWRNTVQLELALFLAQKETKKDDRATPKAGGDTNDYLAGGKRQSQKPVSNDNLDTVRGSDQECGLYQQPEQVHQLTLL